jgi:hypothetical protein
MGRKRVEVTSEKTTGRNKTFHDNYSNTDMTRAQFAKQIEHGNYSNYHIRNINGVKTPVSNPDKTTNNNLG